MNSFTARTDSWAEVFLISPITTGVCSGRGAPDEKIVLWVRPPTIFLKRGEGTKMRPALHAPQCPRLSPGVISKVKYLAQLYVLVALACRRPPQSYLPAPASRCPVMKPKTVETCEEAPGAIPQIVSTPPEVLNAERRTDILHRL